MGNKIVDLTGKRFGRLTVISFDSIIPKQGSHWLCRCDCLKEKIVSSSNLKNGTVKCCGWGCIYKDNPRKIDLTGEIFGKLFVIGLDHKDKNHNRYWLCSCLCGGELVVFGGNLKSGHTKSCGCSGLESSVAVGLKQYCVETYSAIPEYKVFRNPETNCYQPFDIFIPQYKTWIEIMGIQHYENIPYWHKETQTLEYQQHKDNLKKEYAEQNGTYIEIDLRKIKTTEQAIQYVETFM